MTGLQADLFDDAAAEYDLDFIINNPIRAVCTALRTNMCRSIENIHAPRLENVRCFWCAGKVKPVHPNAYRDRIANLWQHVKKEAAP